MLANELQRTSPTAPPPFLPSLLPSLGVVLLFFTDFPCIFVDVADLWCMIRSCGVSSTVAARLDLYCHVLSFCQLYFFSFFIWCSLATFWGSFFVFAEGSPPPPRLLVLFTRSFLSHVSCLYAKIYPPPSGC